MKTWIGLPAPAINFPSPFIHSFGIFFVIFLLIIPSTLVEGEKGHSGITDNKAADAMLISAKIAGARIAKAKVARARLAAAERKAARKAEWRMITLEAAAMSQDLQLEDSGLNEKVLEYALLGYHRLLRKGMLRRTDVLSICDFSQSSSLKRMYVIDMQHRKLLYRTYVAHGINSGQEYANSFSNIPESHKSSLGFYVTREIYYGCNGLSLRIDGMDRGFNNKASQRNIVIHGAPYVSERILHKYGVMGTTFGCPAIPVELSNQVIPAIKNGTCFFIYYPSKRYLARSTVLNG